MTEISHQDFVDPSTFTHIGRNINAERSVFDMRKQGGLETLEMLDIGPGPLDLIFAAALPGHEYLRVTGVDPSTEVNGLFARLKAGKKVLWTEFAEICKNPTDTTPNADFTDPRRLGAYINFLTELGVTQNLAGGLDLEGIQIPQSVADRLTLVQDTGLNYLNSLPPGKSFDFITIAFLNTNLDRVDKSGRHSNALTQAALARLAVMGNMLIGDTSKHLPKLLRDIAEITGGSDLRFTAMTHMAHRTQGVLASTQYLVLGFPPKNMPTEQEIASDIKRAGLRESVMTLAGRSITELSQLAETKLVLASRQEVTGLPKYIVWASKEPMSTAAAKIIPEPGQEFSPDMAGIKAQKPFLKNGRFPEV